MEPAHLVWIIAGVVVILAASAAFLSFGRRRGMKRVREDHETQDQLPRDEQW